MLSFCFSLEAMFEHQVEFLAVQLIRYRSGLAD